jgi:hypothetical protein
MLTQGGGRSGSADMQEIIDRYWCFELVLLVLNFKRNLCLVLFCGRRPAMRASEYAGMYCIVCFSHVSAKLNKSSCTCVSPCGAFICSLFYLKQRHTRRLPSFSQARRRDGVWEQVPQFSLVYVHVCAHSHGQDRWQMCMQKEDTAI